MVCLGWQGGLDGSGVFSEGEMSQKVPVDSHPLLPWKPLMLQARKKNSALRLPLLAQPSTPGRWLHNACRSSNMEVCSLAATMDAEMPTQDEGEMAAEHARDEPGALEEPHRAPVPPIPPPEDPKDPLTATQKPDLPVPAGQPGEEPCNEDMQNSQDDARLDAVLHPRDDISTATERTANGGDFRLELPPKHPLANAHFAGKELQHANPGAQTRSRHYHFSVLSTLVSNSTLCSPYDTVAALAGATAQDPNLLVTNSKNDPASLTSPHVLKTFTELQLMIYFDEQRIKWEGPRSANKSCFLASLFIQMSSEM